MQKTAWTADPEIYLVRPHVGTSTEYPDMPLPVTFKLKYKEGNGPEGRELLFETIQINMKDTSTDGSWSASANLAVKQFWDLTSAESVAVAACMLGLSPKGTKVSMVRALVAGQHKLVTVPVVRAFMAAFREVQAELREPGPLTDKELQAEGAAVPSGTEEKDSEGAKDPVREASTANRVLELEKELAAVKAAGSAGAARAAAAALALKAAKDAKPASGDAQSMGAFGAQMAEMLKTIVGGAPAASKRARQSAYARHLEDTDEALRGGGYVDVLSLNKVYLDNLRMKAKKAQKTYITLGPNGTLTQSGADECSTDSGDAELVTEGFRRLFVILAKLGPEHMNKLADMLGWWSELWEYSVTVNGQLSKPSDRCKAEFACAFMLKHHARLGGTGKEDSFIRSFSEDGPLLAQHLLVMQPVHLAPVRPVRAAAPRAAHQGVRVKGFCFNATDPTRGRCTTANHQGFDHMCPKCAIEHTDGAAGCPQYDESFFRAAVRTRNEARRAAGF
jgi:hypothetical protein